jgi:hypothetical protein
MNRFAALSVMWGILAGAVTAMALDPSSAEVEILGHGWRSDTVWERIGKTKYVWQATVRNNSDGRRNVFVYYDLLDDQEFPLARHVAHQWVEPHQTVEMASDSYILTVDLPRVKSSRATVKVRRH